MTFLFILIFILIAVEGIAIVAAHERINGRCKHDLKVIHPAPQGEIWGTVWGCNRDGCSYRHVSLTHRIGGRMNSTVVLKKDGKMAVNDRLHIVSKPYSVDRIVSNTLYSAATEDQMPKLTDDLIAMVLTGSQLYGLATEESDYDWKGVFMTPTIDLLGLFKPDDTRVTHEPDVSVYELSKFLRLALQGNPNILDLLYAPLPAFLKLTDTFIRIYEYRDFFLSDTTIRNAYGGYAMSQFSRLKKRGDYGSDLKKRYSKHTRHMFRLLDQGTQLLREGMMSVVAADPEKLFALGELEPEKMIPLGEAAFAEFEATKSILPEKPNYDMINLLLEDLRMENLNGC